MTEKKNVYVCVRACVLHIGTRIMESSFGSEHNNKEEPRHKVCRIKKRSLLAIGYI